MQILQNGFYWLMLTLDSLLYRLVSWLCDIFFGLAELNLFNNDFYGDIVRRIYLILGLVMMFILAYTLLQAVINPDNFAKGENSFGKIAMNVVVSLVIIVVLPTVFSLAYNIQNSLLDYHVVEKIVMGSDYESESTGGEMGRTAAYYVMSAFFHPDEDYCATQGIDDLYSTGDLNRSACADTITVDGVSLTEASNQFLQGSSKISTFRQFSDKAASGDIDYSPFLSLIAAIAVAYVFLSFCFDMGIRVVKLMYFEIIAPIPVVCRVIPGGNMKSVFNDWVKKTISTYLEVFIRLFTVYLCLYLIQFLLDNGIYTTLREVLTGPQSVIAWAFIIMGIFAFMRQAPKLISEMFHLDSGNMNLGIMNKLAAGGGLIAGAAIGGGLVSAGRNLVSGVGNTRESVSEARKNGKSGVWAGISGSLKTAGSTLAGGTSAAARGGRGALGAKNSKDMFAALNKGADDAGDAKSRRTQRNLRYKAEGHNFISGHVSDYRDKAYEYMGINSLDDLNKEKAVADEMQGFYKTMAGYVEDNEMVANYRGLYEAEMKKEIPTTIFDEAGYNKEFNDSYEANLASIRGEIATNPLNSQYQGMTVEQIENLAKSRVNVDRSKYQKNLTKEQRANFIAEREKNLKMYDNLQKLATMKAINDKLNDKVKNADGTETIIDGRFQAVANQVEVFKKQNGSYDFVNQMHQVQGITWDSKWDDLMKSGDAAAIDAKVKEFKQADGAVTFFADSEQAKNHSGAVSAEIAKKLQEKKGKEDSK